MFNSKKSQGKYARPFSNARGKVMREWEDAAAISGFFFFGISVIVLLMAPLYAAMPMGLCLVNYGATILLHKARKKGERKNERESVYCIVRG